MFAIMVTGRKEMSLTSRCEAFNEVVKTGPGLAAKVGCDVLCDALRDCRGRMADVASTETACCFFVQRWLNECCRLVGGEGGWEAMMG